MSNLEENITQTIQKINNAYDLVDQKNWGAMKSEIFLFELERVTQKLKEIYELITLINKETLMLLEKNTPDISNFIEELRKELVVFESNIKMERTKTFRIELINTTEQKDVPELYKSLQQKILQLCLKARYEIERINKFMIARKVPNMQKGSTAKSLLEVLQKREEELIEIKKKNLELKRKSFFRTEEKNIVDIEEELNEKDKRLEESVNEARRAMKTHLAQITYVEGSFTELEKRIKKIEEVHTGFAKKSIELIKELKKERDYARKMTLEIENETLKIREEHTRQILDLEDKKQNTKQQIEKKYITRLNEMKKEIEDKHIAIQNMQKIINSQEKEINQLKENFLFNEEIKKSKNELTNRNDTLR